jgi:ABC-type transport system involved in cytochrome c biogenesis permease subunit
MYTLSSLAAHTYILAALVYLAFLVRQWSALATAGRLLVAGGLGMHAVALGLMLGAQGGAPSGLGQGFSLFAFLLLAIFLGLDLRFRRPVLGAFVTPLAVAVMVPVLLLHGAAAPLPPVLRGPLLPVHVTIALLGLAAFAVAAAVAVMYLVMERQVKAKHFGLLFARMPSLEFLDRLNRRLVIWGFIALSVTLVTGSMFANHAAGLFWVWDVKQVVTVGAWVIFAALLNARFFAGWQGRRVALLTMAGFGLLLVSFLSSYAPQLSAGAALH